MTDVILALNAGSSSIKFSLFVVFLPFRAMVCFAGACAT